MSAIATVTPLGCAHPGCGVIRRQHDTDHRYQPPGWSEVKARADARKQCGHWIGAEAHTCGSQIGVRAFIQGPRCPIHDPNALEGGAA